MAIKQGSGFTNIQRVLQANQNNRLGSTIGGGIEGQADQFKTGLNQSQNAFQQDIDKAKTDLTAGKEKATGILGQAQSLQGGQKLNDDDVNAFKSFTGSTYKGPTGLKDADKLQMGAQQAQGLAKATKTQEGRQGLLQQFVGKGQYTGGQQKLDTMLLGQTGANDLRGARRAASGLAGDLTQVQGAAQGVAKQTQNMFQNSIQDVLGKTQQGVGNIRSAIDTKFNEIKNRDESLYNTSANDLRVQDDPTQSRFGMSPELMRLLGFSSGENVYGLKGSDLAAAIQLDQATKAKVASPEEFARYQALRKLAGMTPDTDDVFAGQEADVGKYKGIIVDGSKVRDAKRRAQEEFEAAMKQGIGVGYVSPNNAGVPIQSSDFTPEQAEQLLQYFSNEDNIKNPDAYDLNNNLKTSLANYYARIGKNRTVNGVQDVGTLPVGVSDPLKLPDGDPNKQYNSDGTLNPNYVAPTYSGGTGGKLPSI